MLAAITVNKVLSLHAGSWLKNGTCGGRRVLSRSAGHPSAELVDSVISEGNQLLETLPDESLRLVARMRMEGYSNQEIADHIDRSVKSVERKLRLIRKVLESKLAVEDE